MIESRISYEENMKKKGSYFKFINIKIYLVYESLIFYHNIYSYNYMTIRILYNYLHKILLT